MDVFSHRERTDRTPARANESQFAFLDRAAPEFFTGVRDLLQSWVNALPAKDQSGVVGNLSSGDDHAFTSAFWELYLHRLVTGAGYEVELHPDVPGSNKHPDLLVHGAQPFYLEAVSVGVAPDKQKPARRLAEVEAAFETVKVKGWTLRMTWDRVGPLPLRTRRLRSALLAWIATLERPDVHTRFGDPPLLPFDEDGWKLDFTALPVSSETAPLVSMRGPARAAGSDNKPGLERVLSNKSRRYGTELPHPLVTAVLSNSVVPTKLYEIQPTLYGLHSLGPTQVTDFSELVTDGHWRTHRGWRRSHNPYVVVGAGIDLYSMHRRVPWSWRTLDPAVEVQVELPWTAAVDVSVAEPGPPQASPDLNALGIDDSWCSMLPDFDVR